VFIVLISIPAMADTYAVTIDWSDGTTSVVIVDNLDDLDLGQKKGKIKTVGKHRMGVIKQIEVIPTREGVINSQE